MQFVIGICNASSEGSLGSKMAVLSPFSKMSVNTVLVILTLASVNHFIGFSHIKIDYFIPLLVPSKFSEQFYPKIFLARGLIFYNV
jgi:hypothetical protein